MATPPTLRERTRRAVHGEITAAALRLFSQNGFDATTVDQIAAEAGISRRSFFHYFGSKEDVVLGDLVALGDSVRATLESRPAEETAWEALREAFRSLRDSQQGLHDELMVARLYHDAPSLRARHLEKHLRWQDLLAPDVQRRLGLPDTPAPDPRARALVAAALACLDAAVDAWALSDGTADLEQLYDDAITVIRA